MKKLALLTAFAAAVAFCTPAFAVAQSDIGKQRAAEIADVCKNKGMEYIPHDEADIKRLGTMAGREFEQAKKFSCIASAKTQQLPGNAKRASFDARPLAKAVSGIIRDVRRHGPNNRRPISRPRHGQQEDTFENVAAGSLSVTTKDRTFNLRNIGGRTDSCRPPLKLVRSDRCTKLPGGGIRCKFDCMPPRVQ
ncbi:hypothetical protein A2943_00275 [Candidatus Adlerbacteria bacterium RIFCSPLOWO2_01_FULL_51_16]|uniref:Uncharacterized protein n=1 Tax=Candidatus Adlerbacteria bacterium RIFCSPLOWO2_01_FULL_51_16 TaxID=1797243 RepID=A0A1F4XH68_9BACT|nr:MAG: hypothetical protein A2943_00275 [Candidatus Adlerbacteria bacterium RIFCSPLOWO2_01_FULL_51_16]